MIVTIHALFSHNKLIGSKIIAEGTRHLASNVPKCSHTALLINGRWVHEATGSGVHVMSYEVWSKQHNEVARVQLESREYQEVADEFRKIQDSDYDYLGVIYLGLCVIPTFFGKKLPKENKWQSSDKYFCCEVLGYLTSQDYDMCSPIQILSILKEKYG